MKKRWAFLLPAALLAWLAVPIVIEQPFSAQSPRLLALAFGLRRFAPHVTIAGAACAVFLAVRLWRRTPSVVGRTLVACATVVSVSTPWLAWQNPFELIFRPLAVQTWVSADRAGFMRSDDVVLAVTLAGDSAAYPVRQLAYHHVVNDVVGGVPLVATY